jgi:hypothetical protein
MRVLVCAEVYDGASERSAAAMHADAGCGASAVGQRRCIRRPAAARAEGGGGLSAGGRPSRAREIGKRRKHGSLAGGEHGSLAVRPLENGRRQARDTGGRRAGRQEIDRQAESGGPADGWRRRQLASDIIHRLRTGLDNFRIPWIKMQNIKHTELASDSFNPG